MGDVVAEHGTRIGDRGARETGRDRKTRESGRRITGVGEQHHLVERDVIDADPTVAGVFAKSSRKAFRTLAARVAFNHGKVSTIGDRNPLYGNAAR